MCTFFFHSQMNLKSKSKRRQNKLLLLVVLVGNIALLPDLTLVTSERVVLGEDGDGPCKLLEEVVLALGHLLNIGLGPLVSGKLVVHYEQALIVQYVPVVVVIQHHGRASVVPHILHGLRVWDYIRALVKHVLDMVRVQHKVDLWVEPVNQLDTVGSAHAVGSCYTNSGDKSDAPTKQLRLL